MIVDRVTSIAIVCAYALFTWLVCSEVSSWWTSLLVGMAIAGHSHYILGLWYQYESFGNRSQPRRARMVLGSIIIVAAIITFLALILLPDRTVYIFVFVFFLLHALHNELTAIANHKESSPLLLHTIPLAGIVIGFFLTTLAHSSIYFHNDLTYSVWRPTEGFITYASYGYTLLVAGSLAGILVALRYRSWGFAMLYGVVFGLSLVLRQFDLVIPFVYFIYGTLLYHIAIWFVSYLRKVWNNPIRRRVYIVRHIMVIGMFGIMAIVQYLTAYGTGMTEMFFTLDFFIFTSVVHAMTSLLNEPFAERLISPRII